MNQIEQMDECLKELAQIEVEGGFVPDYIEDKAEEHGLPASYISDMICEGCGRLVGHERNCQEEKSYV